MDPIKTSQKLSWKKFAGLAKSVKERIRRLTALAGIARRTKVTDLGYPVNHHIVHLRSFYRWYLRNNLDSFMMNCAGDPFENASKRVFSNLHDPMAVEKKVLEFFAPLYGFDKDNFWGIVSFSGTDGNNHGIYFGASLLKRKTGMLPILYVSDAAHYSNMRLGDLQNLEVRIIPSNVEGSMDVKAFEKALDVTKPALVVYAMGTTFKGGIDDQAALNAVLEKKKPIALYRHVDAALFGGYLPYTDEKALVDRRVQPFDSIAVSGHKYFGMDEPCGFLLTTREVLEAQHAYCPKYLNGEMFMIHCSRSSLAPLKFWWIITKEGISGFTRQSKEMLAGTQYLFEELKKLNYPCWLTRASNTVYFKRPNDDIMDKYDLAPDFDKRLGGDLAHVIVMQHVTREVIDCFLADLKRSLA